jgi:hypothetical protein
VKVSVRAGLDLPHLPEGDRLRSVLASALASGEAAAAGASAAPRGPYWDANFFGLDRSSAFGRASEESRRAVLSAAGRGLLEEAYFIEKAGLAFTAKMCLLAESTEERMLYSLFSADEAEHFAAISRFVEGTPDPSGHPFLSLLSSVIENGDRDSLVFLIQIVLEGWGLTHYRAMSGACLDPALSAALQGVLKDEARHHGSGLVLIDAGGGLQASSREYVTSALVRFLSMVRAGPQGVVFAVESVLGGSTRRQRIKLLEELDTAAHAHQRLELLRGLMVRAGAGDIVADLEGEGMFAPLPPEALA